MFPIQDTIPSYRFPLMNWCIIGLNTIIFLFQLSLNEQELDILFHNYGLVPIRYTQDVPLLGYIPFLSSMFLHGGWGHFLGNMWTLFIFGDNVEDRMGAGRYLIFYILSGIAAGVLHYYLNMYSIMPTIGASGAIAGVMGAYMVLYPRSRIIFLFPIFFIPYFIEIPAVLYLGFWFLGELSNGTTLLFHNPEMTSGIAFWAHVGGFIAGIVLHGFFLQPRSKFYRDHDYYSNYYSDF